jgi:uncharacterized protein YfaS (alpha-2-macroglobulin family)
VAGLYDFGDTAILTAEWRDPEHAEYPGAASLVDPTTVTLRLRRPDGTEDSSIIPDNPSTGIYEAEVTLDQSGSWGIRFEAEGTWDGVQESSIIVRRSDFT